MGAIPHHVLPRATAVNHDDDNYDNDNDGRSGSRNACCAAGSRSSFNAPENRNEPDGARRHCDPVARRRRIGHATDRWITVSATQLLALEDDWARA